ncbi:MAG TPA: 2-hydroxyacid dehydrogenase [Alphaproteobacteria bacterium]|nr:2-hydroxyacid dehydrogenase [Alphaproteobacteria bacterium]
MATGAEMSAGERPAVLWLPPMPQATIERLQRTFDAVLLEDPTTLPEAPERFRGLAATVAAGASRDLLAALPNLEIIACFGVGYDSIDVGYAREHGIPVTNTPDVLTECVADFGMALVLACLRRMGEGERYVRAGRWTREGAMAFGRAPRGKRLGILGLGRIGLELAKRAEVFGMQIAYHNRSRRDGVAYDYHDDAVALARASDVLALTCPGGQETHHLVNAEVLRALGPEGVLVNIARGSVVDEAALVQALEDGVIGGAGLDVFEAEPEVPATLMTMENVVLQPHQASATVETRNAMGDLMIDNLVAHFEGRGPLTPV